MEECYDKHYRKICISDYRITHSGDYWCTINKIKLRNSYHYTEIKIFTIYLSYNVAAQRSAYVSSDSKQPIYNGRGERELPPNLIDKEDAMGDPFHITLFVQAKGTEKSKKRFAKIGIKTRLIIHTRNDTRPTYTMNITIILKHDIY